MRKIIIFGHLFLLVFLDSNANANANANDSTRINIASNVISIQKLRSTFIQLVPFKGIIINSDSILIGKVGLYDLLNRFDTNSVKFELKFDSPKHLVISSSDSPPPCIGDCPDIKYHHKPDEYFVIYSALLKIDSLEFYFGYGQSGQNELDQSIFKDSLMLRTIKVNKSLNAGLHTDLKIGDTVDHIYKYYERPNNCDQQERLRKEISENGVKFTIETDETQCDDFGRIIKIEINCLTRY